MKMRHLFLLLLILAALGTVWFLKSQKTTSVETRDLFIPFTIKIDPNQVFEATIKKGADEVVLKKIVDKGWFLKTLWNAPVQEEKVTALLKLLAYVEGELRTSDEKLLGDFGLRDEEAYSLELKSVTGQSMLHLLIGTRQPDELSVFFRKAGENKVYLSNMPILRAFNIFYGQAQSDLDQKFWLDLDLTHRDFSEAKKVTIKQLDGFPSEIQFEKTADEKWKIKDPLFAFETDNNKVGSLLMAMSSWVGLEIADPKKEYGFREKGIDLKVTFEGRDRERFFMASVGSGETEKYYVKKDGDFRVMEIAKGQVERLKTDKIFYIQKNPFGVYPEKIKEVLLRHKTSEMFLGATADQMDLVKKIANVFSGFELKVMRLDSTEDLLDFENNVPYEIVLRESATGPTWNLGLSEKNAVTGRYTLKVKGDDRFFTISEDVFQSLFFPFQNSANETVTEATSPLAVTSLSE